MKKKLPINKSTLTRLRVGLFCWPSSLLSIGMVVWLTTGLGGWRAIRLAAWLFAGLAAEMGSGLRVRLVFGLAIELNCRTPAGLGMLPG